VFPLFVPKSGMAHFLPSFSRRSFSGGGMVQILLIITRVAVQVLSEPVNYHGTGFLLVVLAQCRYNQSRSQKSVMVQDLNCGQMRVSGCKNHYEFILGAGAKVKTMTNNLPILSVLWLVLIF
jgi:hypothetical protein